LVKILREQALAARKKAKLDDYFRHQVELNLKIYTDKILDKTGSHEYVGDLDAFVAGICESLQPANTQALKFLHHVFRNTKENYPDQPIFFLDDSQVVKFNAEKLSSKKPSYTLSIREVKTV